jgi:spoIIIJ-associated protein
MVEIVKFEEKTKDEALKKCLTKLDRSIDNIYYKEREIEGKLFKSKKFEITAIKKDDVIKFVKNYFNEVSKMMNIDIKSEVKEKDDVIVVVLVTSNNSIIIGKEGRTLNSLQMVLKQAIKVNTDFNIKLNIDVANYKNKKIKNIEYEVRKIVKEVLNSKIEAKLDPMNSYERRLVHTIVSEYKELSTESQGENPERYVIIKYND